MRHTVASAFRRTVICAAVLAAASIAAAAENALLDAHVPVRHIELGVNVPMYRTNRPCRPAGVFHGPLVVSMRPMSPEQAITATRVCGRFPRAHGTPVHCGDPAGIGINDLMKPDFGDPVDVRPGVEHRAGTVGEHAALALAGRHDAAHPGAGGQRLQGASGAASE